MSSESQQHKLDRVRRPRVQITYDVETNGALQKIELPFVVGVLADLSGQPKTPLKPIKERKFAAIDRDNFNDVLAKAEPRKKDVDKQAEYAAELPEIQTKAQGLEGQYDALNYRDDQFDVSEALV